MLGLGVGYLFWSNLNAPKQLEMLEKQYNSAAEPATDTVTTEDVRKAWKNTDYVKFGDYAEDLPHAQRLDVNNRMAKQAASVASYENAGSVAEIQGVMMTFDRSDY